VTPGRLSRDRRPVASLIVLVDADYRILASSAVVPTERFRWILTGSDTLAADVRHAAASLAPGDVTVINGVLMRIVALAGELDGLRAIIFEELRMRGGVGGPSTRGTA
jgi:hypothetical protein